MALFFHGTTVATNTVIEKKGAKTGLFTTAGFCDVLEVGRTERPLTSTTSPWNARSPWFLADFTSGRRTAAQ